MKLDRDNPELSHQYIVLRSMVCTGLQQDFHALLALVEHGHHESGPSVLVTSIDGHRPSVKDGLELLRVAVLRGLAHRRFLPFFRLHEFEESGLFISSLREGLHEKL